MKQAYKYTLYTRSMGMIRFITNRALNGEDRRYEAWVFGHVADARGPKPSAIRSEEIKMYILEDVEMIE